jgi:SAM-dependent methyltransferase
MKDNHFSSDGAAKAYAEGRPYVHDRVIARVRKFLNLKGRVPLALDVACGTGLSTIAMKEMAERVVGLDISLAMLSLAPRDPETCYVQGVAEDLPFGSSCFAFVSVSSAYHWFDKKKFAAELGRITEPGAWAVIYETHFTGHLQGCPQFDAWYKESFRKRYPAPPRDYSFSPSDFEPWGVDHLGNESFDYSVPFSAPGFANHLLSMTNVTWAVEKGEDTLFEAANWLRKGMRQFDVLRDIDESTRKGNFLFKGSIEYLRKQW